jgi:class 3 adenylate cyclase
LVDAAQCLETRNATVERNVGAPADLEESEDNLTGDDIDIAARLGGIAEPSAICPPEEAHRQLRA